MEDIRWKQRLSNFDKALSLLHTSLKINNPSDLERAGIVQFFEITFELSWKLIKDFIESEGINELASPRQIIKKAFEIGIITDGHIWIKALDDRNATVHIYDNEVLLEIETAIRNIYQYEFELLQKFFYAKV
jgi:nucleotidyltransferase substrate binding protein (TIGR01987 family)